MIPALPAGVAAPAASPRPAATPPERSFGAVLEGLSGRTPPGGEPRPGAAFPAGPEVNARAPGIRLLELVDRARARLDDVLAAARSGRTFTAQELLGLQAEAYRTVQTVDLGVKLVEQGAQAVRQTLAAQV